MDLLRGQELLLSTSAHAGDRSIRAFDIANEIDDAKRRCRRAHARAWVARMAAALRRGAPDVPVRIGAHLLSLTTTNNMRVDDLGAILDGGVMHAYPLYSASARGLPDPELVPFACAPTSAPSERGRPTLMQEFSLCTAPTDRSEKPAAQVFRELRRARDGEHLRVGAVQLVLDVSPDEYHAEPGAHLDRLYAQWIAGQS